MKNTIFLLLFTFSVSVFGNALYTKPQGPEFFLAVEEGRYSNYEIVNVVGTADNIGTSLTVVASAKLYQTPTALTALEVLSSDNTNDKAGQAGAQIVRFEGICAGWVVCSENVTLNGTTAVDLVNTYFRVFHMRVIQSGAYANATTPSHNSTITLRVNGGGATWATIVPDLSFGLARSQIAAYTVPAGKEAYILDYHATVETGKNISLLLFARCNADDVDAPYTGVMEGIEEVKGLTGNIGEEWLAPLGDVDLGTGFVGPCDIGFMAAAASGSTSDVEVDFQLILKDLQE